MRPDLNGLDVVNNETGGEIVNVDAASVVTLEASTLGIARSSTGAAVGGAVLNDTFPFFNQRTLINISGNAQTIQASGDLGNILVAGTVGSVAADTGGGTSTSAGIVGPIYATGGTGNFLSVNIGRGLPTTGTGSFAQTGIFADNGIGTITGNNANIAGDIVTSNVVGGTGSDTDHQPNHRPACGEQDDSWVRHQRDQPHWHWIDHQCQHRVANSAFASAGHQ